MPRHDLEWRKDITVAQYNGVIRGDFVDDSKPFPLEDWIVSVDGAPIAEVDGLTRLEIMAEVFFTLQGLQATWLRSSGQHTNGDGASSSASSSDMTKISGET